VCHDIPDESRGPGACAQGLVVPIRIEGELPDQLAVLGDDADVGVGNEEADGLPAVSAANADVVEILSHCPGLKISPSDAPSISSMKTSPVPVSMTTLLSRSSPICEIAGLEHVGIGGDVVFDVVRDLRHRRSRTRTPNRASACRVFESDGVEGSAPAARMASPSHSLRSGQTNDAPKVSMQSPPLRANRTSTSSGTLRRWSTSARAEAWLKRKGDDVVSRASRIVSGLAVDTVTRH
jgi:hypothetical protein